MKSDPNLTNLILIYKKFTSSL